MQFSWQPVPGKGQSIYISIIFSSRHKICLDAVLCRAKKKKKKKVTTQKQEKTDKTLQTSKQTNIWEKKKWQALRRRNVKGNTYKCRPLLPFAGAAWLWRSADLWPPSWGPGHPAPFPGLLGSVGLWPRGSDACTPGVRCKTTTVAHAEVLTLWPVTRQALNKIHWYITAIQSRMPLSKGKVCYSSVLHGKSVGAQKSVIMHENILGGPLLPWRIKAQLPKLILQLGQVCQILVQTDTTHVDRNG